LTTRATLRCAHWQSRQPQSSQVSREDGDARGAATTRRALPPETMAFDKRVPRGTTPPQRPGGIAAAPVRATTGFAAANPPATGLAGAKPLTGFAAIAKQSRTPLERCGGVVVAGFCTNVAGALRLASAKPVRPAISAFVRLHCYN